MLVRTLLHFELKTRIVHMEQELAQVTELYNLIAAYLVTYSFQIFGAIVIRIIGNFLARRMGNVVQGMAEKKGLDITLSRFFGSCTRISIISAAVIIVLPKLGVQVTPFVAAIGAVGLGAGLAVQGLLSNYSAGLSIIFTRIFVVGDTIRVQGVFGVVKEVHLGFTTLTNEDGELITIPNKHIVGEIIHNSQSDTVLELAIGIAYGSDPEAAIAVIKSSLSELDGLSSEREVQVGIDGFGDSSIDLSIRAWAKTEQYFDMRYQANMLIHKALKDSAIEIPFPQREVRMLQ